MTPRLLSLATSVPPYEVRQDDVRNTVGGLFGEETELVQRLASVFGNAGIERRYSCVPLAWYLEDHGWAERSRLFIENAVELLTHAARRCVGTSGLAMIDVDAVVIASTTGIATPSLDALLIERLGLRRNVDRLPIFGLGCAGGVIGLARAAELARAAPAKRILVGVVELCGLTFRRSDRSKSNIVATALFGDGAAAALIGSAGDGPTLSAAAEHTWPDTLDVMGWGIEDDGLRVVFSRDIPTLVRTKFRAVLDAFLARRGLSVADVDAFLCHPGGAKVLDALEEVLCLPPGGLDHSRHVLRQYGNMSAVTVLFVLERAMREGGLGRRAVMSALGPGFTAGFLLLEAGIKADGLG